MAWTNGAARVYHGTTLNGANSILAAGVIPSQGRGAADFGQGFYVTSDLHQARQWANQKVRSASGFQRAAVVEFDLDRDLLSQYGDHLTFVLADSVFHDFVLYNRLGGSIHARYSVKKSYDVVFGPVAAFPQTLVYANCDQICFVAPGDRSKLNRMLTANSSLQIGNPYL